VANFGDHLFPRIFEHELLRRLPTASVKAFSPLGYLHPVGFDRGLSVEPLGEWRPERIETLARDFDLVAIGGGEIIHGHDDVYALYYDTNAEEARRLAPSTFFIEGLGRELKERSPVAWNSVGIPFDLEGELAQRVRSALEHRAYVSVREEISRDRLLRAGVTREIVVVPDSAFLIDRIVTESQIARRLAYLRGVGSYPASKQPLIVQGSRALLPHVAAIAEALAEAEDIPIVLLETGPCHGDGEFAEAIANTLGGHIYRMPANPTVADVVAAIVSARAFVGLSLHGNEIAVAYGVPNAILDLGLGYSKLAGFAALARCEDALVRSPEELKRAVRRVVTIETGKHDLGEVKRRIDTHFDALAELAERSAARQSDRPPRVGGPFRADDDLQRAFEARGRRLVEQRLRLADEIEKLERQLEANESRAAVGDLELAGAKGALAEAKGALAEAKGALAEAQGALAVSERACATTQDQLDKLLGSKTFRYTSRLRAVYGWSRSRHIRA
jgi:hypothetical protein